MRCQVRWPLTRMAMKLRVNKSFLFELMEKLANAARSRVCALLTGFALNLQDHFALVAHPLARKHELEGITCQSLLRSLLRPQSFVQTCKAGFQKKISDKFLQIICFFASSGTAQHHPGPSYNWNCIDSPYGKSSKPDPDLVSKISQAPLAFIPRPFTGTRINEWELLDNSSALRGRKFHFLALAFGIKRRLLSSEAERLLITFARIGWFFHLELKLHTELFKLLPSSFLRHLPASHCVLWFVSNLFWESFQQWKMCL